MKSLLLLFAFFITGLSGFSQVVFTYGNNAVTKDEFLKAYNKNKTAVTDKDKALRAYLDLYIKFKLKVQAAREMHLDTLSTLKNDLQNFRSQIEESYLNDDNRMNALMQEAFERSQKDIHIQYSFYEGEDAATIERTHSSINPSAKGDLGFVTVFSLPYEMENVVYSLRPGQESKPIKAKNGFYIFKNMGERKAYGKIRAAQILIAIPEGAKNEDNLAAKKLADSIYHAILAGGDFGELAKRFSNDKMTYMSGGNMPEFGVGRYDPAFEEKVFALQKDGDITPPFQTPFGYHIVKRLSHTNVPADKNDAAYLYTIKQQVQQDARANTAKEKFIADVLKKLGYKKNNTIRETELWKMTDSFVVTKKAAGIYSSQTTFFSFTNTNISIGAWLKFVQDYMASGLYRGESYTVLLNKFVSTTALDNYRNRLSEFNPDFKDQLQEFKEGNMLFEVMERNVWSRASADSAGLKNYYTLHKNEYLWNASADAVLISASNEKVGKDAAQKIKNGLNWRSVAEENSSQVQADSGRYEVSQLPVNPVVGLSAGIVTDPVVNQADGTAAFVKIIRLYPAGQQRSFEEARGLVINDYQNFLEEKWLEQLKKKYPVKVNEKVFQSL